MKNKLGLLFLLIIGIVLYSLTIKGVYYNVQPSDFKNKLDQMSKPLELSPERGRFAHVIALVDEHTYALNQELGDAVYPDVGYYNGKFFSFFAPGISYMAMPFYMLGEHYNLSQVATYAMVSVFSILALMFMFKVGRDILKLPLWASLASVIIFAFGSSAWAYAGTLYQHHLTAFFIISSFYGVWKYRQRKPLGWLWSLFVWINYALAISIDYPNAILMLPVMVYLLIVSISIWHENERLKLSIRPAILLTFVAFLIISGLHAYHNEYYLGNWKQLSGGLIGYKALKEKKVLDSSDPNQAIKDLQGQKEVSGFFKETNLPFSFYTLTVASDRGLFLYAPIFLLALVGIYFALNNLDLEYGVLLSLVCLNIFLYSSWGDPWGGWAFGPRYLIPSMAILSLFIGLFLRNVKYKWSGRILVFLLFMYSSAIALLGTLTTNAVPPKVEGVYLHIKYNFLYNWQVFKEGKSSSFIYNTYFSSKISLMEYYLIIYLSLLFIMLVILFIIPLFEHEPHG